jgi:Mrp family chromosome partitioning ATPase
MLLEVAKPQDIQGLRTATGAERPGDDDFRTAMDALFAKILALTDAGSGIVVQVAAATRGEGTSTIARGLAAAGSRAGWCRTALISDNVAASEDLLPRPGALPALLERSPLEGIPLLQHEVIEGAAMDTGVLQTAGAGVPSVDRIRWLFDALRSTHALTVIDSPPVLSTARAVTMSRLTDGVVLVVAAERVRSAKVTEAQGQLAQFGANLLGVVLNRRRERLPRFLARLF